MATSKRSDSAGISSTLGGLVRPRLSRYDLVLGVIPVAFLLSGILTTILGLSVQTAIVLASVVCLVAIVDGLFVNPPKTRPK